MSTAEAYALLGDPTPYVSRKTRGNVTTVTIRLKCGGRTRCKATAERVAPNGTWRINAGAYTYTPKRMAVLVVVRDVLADEGGAS